ncbi:MAG: hypothetical protein HYU77_16525 [Betaproteobacteria bacterium]|nr:hypothetical protein [Betaproteobacteria bacterium]
MPKLHVTLKKEEIDETRLDGKVVLVLDVLFATTTPVSCRIQVATPARFMQFF